MLQKKSHSLLSIDWISKSIYNVVKNKPERKIVMQFKIGFALSEEKKEETTAPASAPVVPDERLPRRSVVRVHFPQRNMTLA